MSDPAQLNTLSRITEEYFARTKPPSVREQSSPAKHSSLTASARYIARSVRQYMGENGHLSESNISSEEDLLSIISFVEERDGEKLSDRERASVLVSIQDSICNYDILTPLIKNEDVNDIIVRSFNDISVQVGRSNIQTDLSFFDHDTYSAFVENILKRAGKSCTTATPVVDATLDKNLRICVAHQSLSPEGSGPMMTIRIARHQTISLESLASFGMAPTIIFDYLTAVVESGDATILIAGEVGTGKTTLVRALASAIPDDEAILAVEDTHEITLNRQFVRTLLTREANTEGSGRISPAFAIRTGMRMAMNRLILGEMRDAEAAETFIDACSSGHSGMSTIHAKSARDAAHRLELFLARAQGSVETATIRKQIANAVSLIIYIGVDKEFRQRRILEVVEIESAAEGSIQFSPLFRFNPQSSHPQWITETGISRFSSILKRKDIVLRADEIHQS